MRQGGGQLPHHADPVHMCEICLELAQPLALLFGTLALRDVSCQGQAERMTALPKQADSDLDREHGAILAPMRSLEAANLPGLESLSDPLAKRCICTRVEVTRRHPDEFLTRVAQALAGLSVHVKNLALIVAVYEQGIGRVIHKSPETGLG